MSLTKKVAFNTAAQVTSRIIQTIGGLVILKLVAQYLGVSGIGELTTVFAYVGLVGIFADMGFFLILVREIARNPARERELTNNVITLRSLFGVALFLVGFGIVWLLNYSEAVKVGVGIYSAASFWQLVGGSLAAVFQSHYRIDKAAYGDIVRTVFNLIGVVVAIRLDAGLSGILVAYLIGNFLGFATQFALLQSYVRFRPAFDRVVWGRILKEALPMGMVTVLGFIYFKIDTVMLSLMKSPVDVGIYGPSFKVLEVIAALPTYFMSAVMPIYAGYLASKDRRLPEVFQRSFDALIMMALPFVIGGILIAQPLVELLTTQEFIDASTVSVFGHPATAATALQILIVTALFLFANHAFGYVLIAAGHQRRLIGPYVAFTLFNVAVNFAVIPRFSYAGTAAVTVATEILVVAVSAFLVKRLLGMSVHYGRLGRTLVAGAVLAACLYIVRDRIAVALVLGAVVYPVALVATGALGRSEIARFLRGA